MVPGVMSIGVAWWMQNAAFWPAGILTLNPIQRSGCVRLAGVAEMAPAASIVTNDT